MATQADVRRIALSLPEAEEREGFVFSVAGKGFAWPWLERLDPKRARVPNPDVIGVRVANELEKQALLSLDPRVLFTEPHYEGYPAVLVRIPAIELGMLEKVLTDAWLTRAPEEARRDPRPLTVTNLIGTNAPERSWALALTNVIGATSRNRGYPSPYQRHW
jgi:hypothetical protein